MERGHTFIPIYRHRDLLTNSAQIMQPLGTKKSHATFRDKKKSRNLSGQKKSCNLLGQQKNHATFPDKKIPKPLENKKITQHLEKNKKSINHSWKKIMQYHAKSPTSLDKKIMQPLGTKKNYATSSDKKKNHTTSQDKKKIMLSIVPIESKLVHRLQTAPNGTKFVLIGPNRLE